jgi:hypothetical protein
MRQHTSEFCLLSLTLWAERDDRAAAARELGCSTNGTANPYHSQVGLTQSFVTKHAPAHVKVGVHQLRQSTHISSQQRVPVWQCRQALFIAYT